MRARTMMVAAMLGVGVAACASEGGCRSQAQCPSGESCLPPGVRGPCGIACRMERECASSADCADGDVCVEYVGICCFLGELSSQCIPACTADSCAPDQRCDSSGRCMAIPCDEGYACPDHTRCDRASTSGGDAHGCVRITCAGDGDCPGGACVDGACYAGPGTCVGPAP